VEIDTRSFRARPGDLYLLCSDGLTSMVPESRLAELMRQHSGARLRDVGEALIAEANRAGGRDNITVILLRLEEVHIGGGAHQELQPTVVGMPAPSLAGAHPPAQSPASSPSGPMSIAPPTLPAAAPAPARAAPLPATASHTPAIPTTPARGPRPVAAHRPRAAPAAVDRARPRRLRRALVALVVLSVLGLLAAGGYVASRSVYFIGTNSRGLVTIYQGFPYQLPGGLELYNSYYVSGVGATTLSPTRRGTLLDHKLRSEGNAGALVHGLELEELNE
jgi:protein phosphatase